MLGMKISAAPHHPEKSRKIWNKAMFNETGNRITAAKGEHLFMTNNNPVRISKIPTIGNMKPVLNSAPRKACPASLNCGGGMNCKKLFNPKNIRSKPKINLMIEFVFIAM